MDDILNCNQEPVSLHRCYLTNSLLLENVLYSFQVAAVNGFGVGPFSDPVNATLFSQGTSINASFIRLGVTSWQVTY